MLRETLMARRMALLGVACVAIYILSFLLYPYLYYPSRYPLFSVPLFIAVALPAALSAIPRGVPRLRSRPKLLSYLSPACLVIGLTVTMLLVGGRGPDVDYAFQRQISGKEEKAYEFLGSLSGRVLVAGWPDRIDSVVLGSAKPALLTKKSHIIFHTGYADELRRRTYALIDAYFATDVEPLRELAGTFGVTHLIVHREHYEPERRPTYFPPFDEPAKAAATRLGGPEDAETLRQRQAIVYDADGVVILDLRRLAERQE